MASESGLLTTGEALDVPVSKPLGKNVCDICLTDEEDPGHGEIWRIYGLPHRERQRALKEFVAANLHGWTAIEISQHANNHDMPQPDPGRGLVKAEIVRQHGWLFSRPEKLKWHLARLVSRCGLLTPHQAARIYWAGRNIQDPESVAARTMRWMAHRQILYQVSLTEKLKRGELPKLASGEERVYGLGRIASLLIRKWMHEEATRVGNYHFRAWTSEDIDYYQLAHDLGLIDMLIDLHEHARELPSQPLFGNQVRTLITEENFWCENHLGFSFKRSPYWEGAQYRAASVGNMRSDGLLTIGVISDPAKRPLGQLFPLMVENDTGSLEAADASKQIIRYCWLAQSRSIFKRFPDLDNEVAGADESSLYQVPLLYVTNSRFGPGHTRAKNIRKAVRELYAQRQMKIKTPIWTVTLADFKEQRLQAPVISVWDDQDRPQPLLQALVGAALTPERRMRPGLPILPAAHILRIDKDQAAPVFRASKEERLTKRAEQERTDAEEAADLEREERLEHQRQWDRQAEAVKAGEAL